MTFRAVSAGRLPHRISLQRATETKDPAGEVLQAWATVATVWAAVEPISGREAWIAQQANTLTTHRVLIRYRSGVTTKDRFIWGTRTFYIESVITPDEIREHMELMCTEVQAPVPEEITAPAASVALS